MTDRTSIDDLTDAVAEWWRFNTFGARFDSEMHPSFASSARQILDCIQAFLRGRDLLLGPDGLLRAEAVARMGWEPYDEAEDVLAVSEEATDTEGGPRG